MDICTNRLTIRRNVCIVVQNEIGGVMELNKYMVLRQELITYNFNIRDISPDDFLDKVYEEYPEAILVVCRHINFETKDFELTVRVKG